MSAGLWLLVGAAAWIAMAIPAAVVVGRALHNADQRTCGPCDVDEYEPLDVRL